MLYEVITQQRKVGRIERQRLLIDQLRLSVPRQVIKGDPLAGQGGLVPAVDLQRLVVILQRVARVYLPELEMPKLDKDFFV